MTRRELALGAWAVVGWSAKGGSLSGRRAPSFALPDISLKYHDLLDYRGKVLLLDVMLTGCPHCQKLAATLERMKRRFGVKIQVLSIVTPPDTQATVASFVAKYRLSSPILFDCGQVSASYLKATPENPKVDVPHLFLINANGLIIDDWPWSEANQAILEGDALAPVIEKALAPAKK